MCEITGCGDQAKLPPIGVSAKERRLFIKGLVTLPLASVLAVPELTRAAAQSTDTVSITTSDGRTVSASIALPDVSKAPAVLLIHEWWGLNDHIKSVAAEFANLGYIALAVDLYDGRVTTNRDRARSLMQGVDAGEAADTLDSWIHYLRNHPAGTGKVGTVGWCFGGGWSLNASIASPVNATVIYYGNVQKSATDLSGLNSPVLGHFATRDDWINKRMVSGFEASMKEAGKSDLLSVYWYKANHAFANPTSARYDAEDAATAWNRTIGFFAQHLT